MPLSVEQREDLVESARRAATGAYAPYSKYLVGAAIMLRTDELVCGCNVENASYGLTMCAERTAVYHAICGHGADMEIVAVAVSTLDGSPPCGACRQVISEFVRRPDEVEIILTNAQGARREYRFSDLLPFPFKLG